MPKLEDTNASPADDQRSNFDAARRPTVRIDPRELRRLVVALVVTVDEDDAVRDRRRDDGADDDAAHGV